MTLDGILLLEDGWDGGSAKAPDRAVIAQASRLAVSLAKHFPSYQAEFVPTEDGSVQVEWHGDGWDVEMWVQQSWTPDETKDVA